MITADFFSGLGGFSEGARQAGADVQFAANHWDSACEWHATNHPDTHHEQQDLQQLDMRLLPDLSDGLLIAAPACQGHSQNSQPARKGTGGSHAPDATKAQERTVLQRSTAWAVVSAAEVARPRALLVENVPDMQRWELFAAWTGALESLGYHVRHQVLNSADYGSAQDRDRLIVTASLDAPIDLAKAKSQGPGQTLRDCIDFNPRHADHRWTVIADKSERMRVRMHKAQNEAGSLCVWNNVSESKGRPLDGTSPTLTTKSGSQLYLLDGPDCRILNPRELARIQGFPDTYQLPPQRELCSKLIGNAIDVRLARGIVTQVKEMIS
jgi:DNA (cytosine-5)-methyltransferase 1